MVFVACETEISRIAVERAFGAIEFNSGRRKALEAAAEVYFDFDHHWETAGPDLNRLILREVDRASRRRDDIAHGRVFNFISHGALVPGQEDHPTGALFMPPQYNTGRTYAFEEDAMAEAGLVGMFRAKYRWNSEDILEITQKFAMLRQQIQAYATDVRRVDGKLQDAFIARLESAKSQGQGR